MLQFATVKDADVEHLLDNKDAGTTKKAMNQSWRVFCLTAEKKN